MVQQALALPLSPASRPAGRSLSCTVRPGAASPRTASRWPHLAFGPWGLGWEGPRCQVDPHTGSQCPGAVSLGPAWVPRGCCHCSLVLSCCSGGDLSAGRSSTSPCSAAIKEHFLLPFPGGLCFRAASIPALTPFCHLSPSTFLAALRRSPKSPLLSSSSMAPRMKSSTSPTAWLSLNAVPKPWSHCGWMGPGTMTLNSTASTSSAFGNSSPRSWPANAISWSMGQGGGLSRVRPALPALPVPAAGGTVGFYSPSLGSLERTVRFLWGAAQLSSLPASPGAAGITAGQVGEGSSLLLPRWAERSPS